MSNGWATLLIICSLGCGISWRVAWARTHDAGTAVALGVLGFLIPIVGVVVACNVKRKSPPPMPPGWYPDPWRQTPSRWHDGRDWTHHTA